MHQPKNVLVRVENESDRDSVHAVNVSAFESPSEARLVDVLRARARPYISLVAESDGEVIGHIMFSPISLAGYPDLKIMGLAPMSVAPEHQRRGIGSALVRAGLEQCRQMGIAAVVVLGHAKYYPRFGFTSASRFGLDSDYNVPEEVIMAMELQPGTLSGKTGKVKYHAAFNDV